MIVEKVHWYEDPAKKWDDAGEWAKDVKERFKVLSKHEMNDVEERVLTSALKYRLQAFKDEDNPYHMFDDLNGIYIVEYDTNQGKEKYLIEFNNDPVHILRRTTGRAGYSCEHINNDAWLGPFHDIALGNSTIYFYDESGNFWWGRLNARWCITDEGEPDIGVDPNIYPRGVEPFNRRNDKLLKQAVRDILDEEGYNDFSTAETPYKYKGHSDTTSTYPDVKLPYTGSKYVKPIINKEPEWWWDQMYDM
jgi:hypothetical protein